MLVTVYITTYNRQEFLKRAIGSVLSQNYDYIEIIVADDGSVDGSQEYLIELEKLGVVTAILNKSGKSRGACFGRNKAISLAKGKFITGLDDDDYFQPWRIAKFIEHWQAYDLQNKAFSALFDSVVEHRKVGKFDCYDTPVVQYQKLRTSNLVGNQVFTLLDNLRDISGFDEQMPALQDWDTWLRLSQRKGDILNINSRSYIQIQDHGGVRITDKPAHKIRFAFERLMTKLQPLTLKEEIQLLYTMYGYQQINNKLPELCKLLVGGHFRRVAQVVKRTLLK